MSALLLSLASKLKGILSSLKLSHGAFFALGLVAGYEGHGLLKLALGLLRFL